jgi:LPS-assembly protein
MYRSSIALAALLAALALPAAAQDARERPSVPVVAPAPADTTGKQALVGDEVLVSAERLERRAAERLVVGEGVVVVRHKEMRLAADRAVYNEGTKDLVADGNVVFESGPDRLQGEHLELNLETRIGFVEHGQGFVQTYYFTGERIEKQGPDRYFIRSGTFTTCEGVLPDWSFHTTSADVTVDEYLHAWNPSLHVKRVPVFYFPYAVFPVKPDRSTGLLIPGVNYSNRDGLVVRNAFYWAPRDNYDATIGLDYLQKTGWGANGEFRYLLAPRTQGVVNGYYLKDSSGDVGLDERWAFSTRNSHELPLGVHLEAEAFFQSDQNFIATYGNTIEDRSSERTTTAVYLNRSWSAWDFALSGRHEESLITETRTTLTRFPELTIDRTSAQLFGTDLLLKLNASGAHLRREKADEELSTTRLNLAPEVTWPLSLGSVARILPSAGFALTYYSKDVNGAEATRQIPSFRLALEGPRAYRIWDLAGDRVQKLKHLVEPSISYVYIPEVDQENLPQFDTIDRIEAANRLEYSLTNTLYAKVVERRSAPPAKPGGSREAAGEGREESSEAAVPSLTSTQEKLWVKLSQSYSFQEDATVGSSRPFSPIDWEARTKPGAGIELWWRGNFDVYGEGIGYQDVSLTWEPTPAATIRGEWRTNRDSLQDFLDLGGDFTLGRFTVDGRTRYNLADETFVENRISVKYTSQCWDMTVGYVHWLDTFEYSFLISLKGIGTVVKI